MGGVKAREWFVYLNRLLLVVNCFEDLWIAKNMKKGNSM